MVFLNSECKYFFALMRLTDGFLSISHNFKTQMRQKPFFSYILSTYQHILILPAVFKIFTFFCLRHIR